jgi:PAT family beta-lactamase induction signal transducer AmpG
MNTESTAQPNAAPTVATPKVRVPTAAWVASNYFAEGYPYTVVNSLSDLLFKSLGASLSAIGLTSLLHLPYNLRFLWAPALDQWAQRLRSAHPEMPSWGAVTVRLQALLCLCFLAMALGVPGGLPLKGLAGILLLMAALSASQDVAIDALYLELLPSEQASSRWLGVRAPAYRAASLLLAGPLLMWVDTRGWAAGMWLLTAGMVTQTLWHWRALRHAPPVPAQPQRATDFPSSSAPIAWRAHLIDLFRSVRTLRGGAWLLALVIAFRSGESLLTKMRWPFLRDEAAMTLSHYGWVNGTLGFIASALGAALGGLLMARHGLKAWLIPGILAQVLPNVLYAAAAQFSGATLLAHSRALGALITLDNFGSGFGTAALMLLILRSASQQHRALHLALLNALMSLSFTIVGSASGWLAERLGFSGVFALSCALGLAPIALVFRGFPSTQLEPQPEPQERPFP